MHPWGEWPTLNQPSLANYEGEPFSFVVNLFLMTASHLRTVRSLSKTCLNSSTSIGFSAK